VQQVAGRLHGQYGPPAVRLDQQGLRVLPSDPGRAAVDVNIGAVADFER
jgi:hypothetical protein